MRERQTRLYFLIGQSAGFLSLHHALHVQNRWLQERGIGNAGRHFTRPFMLYSHQKLVQLLAKTRTRQENRLLGSSLSAVNDAAAEYEQLYFQCYGAKLKPLLDLVARLRSLPNLESAEIRVACFPGPQDVLLEHLARLMPGPAEIKLLLQAYFKDLDYQRQDSFHEVMLAVAGRDNVRLIPDRGAEPQVLPLSAHWHQEVARFLGQDDPLPRIDPAEKAERLQSRELRKLFRSLNKGNSWPFPVRNSLVTELLALEAQGGWDIRPVVAPAILARAFAAGQDGSKALRDRLPTGSLPDRARDWGENWAPDTGWTREDAAQTAERCPRDLAETIRERLEADRTLANDGDILLLHAFRERTGQRPRKAAHDDPRLTVLVQTFNHEPYLAQALDSILSQKTDFPFQIVVVDDRSTDCNREIIAEYCRRHSCIIPVFLSLKSSRGQHIRQLLSRARTELVALCDGDDYFTDQDKLQKQADFLHSHPECSLCFHRVDVVYEDGSGRGRLFPLDEHLPGGKREKYDIEDLCHMNFIQTNSVMYRWRFSTGLPPWFRCDLVPSDWYWHLLHAEVGDIGFIDEVMSVYRRVPTSLFYAGEISTVAHRVRMGLRELHTLDELCSHFHGKYDKWFITLANGIFSDLLRHQLETGDSEPIDRALKFSPRLGKIFLETLQSMQEVA